MPDQIVTGQLVARTALHIGQGSGNEVTDGLCRRDAEGLYLIPGTAIGGVLRTLAVRLAPRLGSPVCRDLLPVGERPTTVCPCWVCHLFGHSYFPDEDDDDTATEGDEMLPVHASRLCIAHAVAEKVDPGSRIRDGVGIDRASRTSARAGSVKFDFEVLPAGTPFGLTLTLEDANAEDERLLAAVLAEWTSGRCWLGGRSSRGLGAFDLRDVRLRQPELSSPEGLMAFLQADGPLDIARERPDWFTTTLNTAVTGLQDASTNDVEVARSFVSLSFELHLDGPFLSNDPVAAVMSGYDHAPYLNLLSAQGQPILTGSSLRGVWRAQAERIVRTLVTQEVHRQIAGLDAAARAEQGLQAFRQRCPACNPLASRADAPLANCDTLLRVQGGVDDDQEVGDAHLCLACQLFGSTRRGSRLKVEDALAVAATGHQIKIFDFIAIDRFTGGGRDGAKFDALAAWKPVFHVRLHLENPRPWELGWLLLVWRDLQEGLLPVGFGAAKGFGRGHTRQRVLRHGFITDGDCLTAPDATEAGREGLYRVQSWRVDEPAATEPFPDLAEGWVEAFQAQVHGYERRDLPALQTDSYFDPNLMALYEVEAIHVE